MRTQFSKFGDSSRCTLAYLFLPSGSSESPTPASAEGASCPDGWEGDQKCPSIFLIFKYVNKQDFLISNMASKVVNDLCTGLKIWFEVGLSCGLGFTFFDLPYLPGFWNLFSKLKLFIRGWAIFWKSPILFYQILKWIWKFKIDYPLGKRLRKCIKWKSTQKGIEVF